MKLIFFLDIFKTFYFALGNSWLMMLRQFQGNSGGTYMYGYVCTCMDIHVSILPQTPLPSSLMKLILR